MQRLLYDDLPFSQQQSVRQIYTCRTKQQYNHVQLDPLPEKYQAHNYSTNHAKPAHQSPHRTCHHVSPYYLIAAGLYITYK